MQNGADNMIDGSAGRPGNVMRLLVNFPSVSQIKLQVKFASKSGLRDTIIRVCFLFCHIYVIVFR
jgi:hypothetical protein